MRKLYFCIILTTGHVNLPLRGYQICKGSNVIAKRSLLLVLSLQLSPVFIASLEQQRRAGMG